MIKVISWSSKDIGSQGIDGLDLMAGWLTDTLDYTIVNRFCNQGDDCSIVSEMYLSAMTVSLDPDWFEDLARLSRYVDLLLGHQYPVVLRLLFD